MNEETNTEWHKGFPKRKGYYRCRIDGVELQLYLFICELNPKKRYWVDSTGYQITDDVEWTE